MKYLRPDLHRHLLTDVTPEDIRGLGATCILLDADNTSSYDGTTKPLPGSREWVQSMKDEGFTVLLLSNAKEERAGILAREYDIPVVARALKPTPFGFFRAQKHLRCRRRDMVMIGDQLFTDIKGARRAGVHCIYVDRYAKENRMWYWYPFVRTAEAIILFLQEAIDWVRGKSN
ncbi:MAG: YqeG family HAD IIIA-type phosphatase [Acutalibacteraceae bacterium]|nr:YqeG family HAD IIIA-type phosphatase [Acutalibacteraceae bacterium]